MSSSSSSSFEMLTEKYTDLLQALQVLDINHYRMHPFIFVCLSSSQSHLPAHLWDIKLFPRQPRDIISPGNPGSTSRQPPAPLVPPWVLDSSPLSFVTDRVCSLDRIFRHSQVEGLQFVGSRSLSLLFADYTLMLAS